jgi:FXSXX-COOH protein
VDGVTSVVSPDEFVPERVLDNRDSPLEDLAADGEVLRDVDRILANMVGESRLPVAAFNSSI